MKEVELTNFIPGKMCSIFIAKYTNLNSNKYLTSVRWKILKISVWQNFADNFSTKNFSESNSPFTARKTDTVKSGEFHYKYVYSVDHFNSTVLFWTKRDKS